MIIPFFIPHAGCTHQCVFCDQRRISGTEAGPDPARVAPTIERYHSAARPGVPAEVAFYGGTFTALPIERQRAYLEPVQPFIASGAVRGIRISTRPDAIACDILALLRQHHVTTVEIGAQSLDDAVLRCSGRGHSADDSVRAAAMLREQGFRIGMQLMPGLPADTADTFRQTVRMAVSLGPDIVRLYPALVIQGTPLEARYRSGAYAPLSLQDAITWCAEALDAFEQADIEVIRVGLQSTDTLERPGTVVAGPYHPAFRQLVESSRFLRKMLSAAVPGADATFLVNPRDLSSAIGQQKGNLALLREQLGSTTRILPDPAVRRGTVSMRGPCVEKKFRL